MITYHLPAGSTDVSVVIRIIDSADGTPETAVDSATAGLDLEYARELAASADITEATLAALTTAHSDGGIKHIGNGYYRLDLPDAACASSTGVTGCLVHGAVTGMIVIGAYVQLTPAPANVTQFGGTAGTFASGRPEVNTTHIAGSAVSTSSAQLGVNVVNFGGSAGTFASGRPEVNATHWSGTANATVDTAGYPKVTIKSGTGTGELNISSGIVDADVQEIDADATCATNLQRSTAAIVRGVVDTGASTTSIPTSSLSPAAAAADQFKGRIVTFDKDTTTAALRGQATDITANTSGGTLTCTALTTGPASGDTFTIS